MKRLPRMKLTMLNKYILIMTKSGGKNCSAVSYLFIYLYFERTNQKQLITNPFERNNN